MMDDRNDTVVFHPKHDVYDGWAPTYEANISLATSGIEASPEPISKGCQLYDFITEGALMGVLCLFGFCGNTLSMMCLSKDRSKTATPFLLVSLEAADSFFLLTVLILRVVTSIPLHDHGFVYFLQPYLAKYMYPTALIAMTATIYMTLLVTVNRFICVCLPYKAQDLCSVRHARKHVILVVCFCLLYNLSRFLEYDVVEMSHTNQSYVTDAKPSKLGSNKIYRLVYGNIMYFIVMFFIPLITLIILNYKLIKALRETKRKRAQMQSTEHGSRSEEDITLTLIVVVLVFLVTQTPAVITQLLLFFLPEESRQCESWFFYYERISDLFVVFNSSINFIIYCFCSRRFRQILVVMLCKNSRLAREASYMHRPSYRGSYKIVSNPSTKVNIPSTKPNNKHLTTTTNGVIPANADAVDNSTML